MTSARTLRRVRLLSASRATFCLTGLGALLLFSAAAARLRDASYGNTGLITVWDHAGNNALIGGQWAMFGVVWLLHRLPGAGPESLVALTIATAVLASGSMAHDLVKRGWQPAQAAAGVLLTCLNPAVLQLAIGGQPTLFQALGVAGVIVAVDRVEALNDTQSLIVVGLMLALLFTFWPNACFFVLPLAALLPFAFRDVTGYAAATALFVIALVPSLILVMALLLGATLFGLPAIDVVSVWSAPLHGAAPEAISSSSWLVAFGGDFLQPWARLAALCLLVNTGTILIVVRLLISPTERARPATALAALVLPALSGAIMTQFWQLDSAMSVVGTSAAALAAWTITTNLRRHERRMWIIATALGASIGWVSPLLFMSPAATSWRTTLLGL